MHSFQFAGTSEVNPTCAYCTFGDTTICQLGKISSPWKGFIEEIKPVLIKITFYCWQSRASIPGPVTCIHKVASFVTSFLKCSVYSRFLLLVCIIDISFTMAETFLKRE